MRPKWSAGSSWTRQCDDFCGERVPEVLGRRRGDLAALLAIPVGCGAILSWGFDVGFVESTLLMLLLGLCLMGAAAAIFRR